jgi:uncharacterized protein (TIGR02453 family)
VSDAQFSAELFEFLRELRRHNNREWFLENKARYESVVRDPMLRFIAEVGPRLRTIGRHFGGGSMFRIYRDIRFSRDKSPYKTHAAAHFPHAASDRDVHAPGFYLHLEPAHCFAAAGLWHPDTTALEKVRERIARRSAAWQTVLRRRLRIEGERLSRPPRGYDATHPHIEDLKLKDIITRVTFPDAAVCGPRFPAMFVRACTTMSPLMEFLTKALNLAW